MGGTECDWPGRSVQLGESSGSAGTQVARTVGISRPPAPPSLAYRGRVVRFVDLSHAIREGMVTYPGLPGPEIGDHLGWEESHARYAPGTEFRIARISMVANTGTYLDTPAHRYRDGWGLDALPLDRVAGVPGIVVEAEGPAVGPEAFE